MTLAELAALFDVVMSYVAVAFGACVLGYLYGWKQGYDTGNHDGLAEHRARLKAINNEVEH